MIAILKADARKIPLADESVQMVCTSPPYWGLRRYSGNQELVWGGREDCEHEWVNERLAAYGSKGHWQSAFGGATGKNRYGYGNTDAARQQKDATTVRGSCLKCGAWRGAYGLEPTVEMYVQHTVEILREIRRVLRNDGVVFWNIGDSYAASNRGSGGHSPKQDSNRGSWTPGNHRNEISNGLKPKDLCLIPFRVALAAQADGWWVRSDIIWAKPNPMPESVTDRPTRSHEYILMLTKSATYYWDQDAVREPLSPLTLADRRNDTGRHTQDSKTYGVHPTSPDSPSWYRSKSFVNPDNGRNLRSVWTFTTEPYPEAHFATFPEELPRRCILAATKLGDLVLDPFAGSGTVGKVAIELGRRAILCDLAYQDLALKRTSAVQRPLLEILGA